jgi:hypothetical protein
VGRGVAKGRCPVKRVLEGIRNIVSGVILDRARLRGLNLLRLKTKIKELTMGKLRNIRHNQKQNRD